MRVNWVFRMIMFTVSVHLLSGRAFLIAAF